MPKKLLVSTLLATLSAGLLTACNSGVMPSNQTTATVSEYSLKNLTTIKNLSSKLELLNKHEASSDEELLEIIQEFDSLKDIKNSSELQNFYKNLMRVINRGKFGKNTQVLTPLAKSLGKMNITDSRAQQDLAKAVYAYLEEIDLEKPIGLNGFGEGVFYDNPEVLKALAKSLDKMRFTDPIAQQRIAESICNERFGNDPGVLTALDNSLKKMNLTDPIAQQKIEKAIRNKRLGKDPRLKDHNENINLISTLDQNDNAEIDKLYEQYAKSFLFHGYVDERIDYYKFGEEEINEIKGRINIGNVSSAFSQYQLKKFTILLSKFIKDYPNSGIQEFKHISIPMYQQFSEGNRVLVEEPGLKSTLITVVDSNKLHPHQFFDNQITIYFKFDMDIDKIKQVLTQLDEFLTKSTEKDRPENKKIDSGDDIKVGLYTSYRNERKTFDGIDFSNLSLEKIVKIVEVSKDFFAEKDLSLSVNTRKENGLYDVIRGYNKLNEKNTRELNSKWSVIFSCYAQ